MTTITTLPEELLLAIFQQLPWKDLCDVVQVCHHFYKVGTDPSLWANATLNKRKFVTIRWEDVAKVFEIPRYKKSRLDLSNCHGISALRMIHILRQSLKSDISDTDLSGLDLLKIPKGLLSEVVSRSTEVNLNKCKGLRSSKLLALFTRCSKSTTLEHLYLEGVDLVSVPLELLTATIQRLNTVSLMCCSCFTSPNRKVQKEVMKEAIFNAIINSASLKVVNLVASFSTANLLYFQSPSSVKITLRNCHGIANWMIYLT